LPITPQMVELAAEFRRRLLLRERQAASALVRYYGTIWGQAQTEILALEAEIQQMRDAGEDISQAKVWQLERFQRIQRQIEGELDRFVGVADTTIQGGQREAIAAANREAQQLVQSSFLPRAGFTVEFGRMYTGAVEALVGVLEDGSPLAELIRQRVGDAADDFAATLVQSLALGLNPRETAKALRQSFGMGLTDALRISRTEQLRAYWTATLGQFQSTDVVTGWERMASLDDRTCMARVMLDGKIYAKDEPMDDHPQGRCQMLPITKTYRELGIDVDEPDFSRELGPEWFERQDAATQAAMMGRGKFDAWQGGLFTLDQLPTLRIDPIWGNSWTPAALRDLIGGASESD